MESHQSAHQHLPRQGELYAVPLRKSKLVGRLLLCLSIMAVCGCCIWWIRASGDTSEDAWGALIASIVGVVGLGLCLLPGVIRLLFLRKPLLAFTEEGIYNNYYFAFSARPQFISWEEIGSIYEVANYSYSIRASTYLHITVSPSMRSEFIQRQPVFTRARLSFQPRITIPQMILPIPVQQVRAEIKQHCMEQLRHHHIMVSETVQKTHIY